MNPRSLDYEPSVLPGYTTPQMGEGATNEGEAGAGFEPAISGL